MLVIFWYQQVVYLREIQLYHAARNSCLQVSLNCPLEDVLNCSLNDTFVNFQLVFFNGTLKRISFTRSSLSISKDTDIFPIQDSLNIVTEVFVDVRLRCNLVENTFEFEVFQYFIFPYHDIVEVADPIRNLASLRSGQLHLRHLPDPAYHLNSTFIVQV